MPGTTISAQTQATPPISRAARVPLSGNQTGLAPQVAATWSPVVVTLSGMGIVSDATNGLGYPATPPAGATGQEVAINAGLAAAWTASGGAGLRVIWDVAVALGAPIYYPGSNTEIIAPSKACGAIMRIQSNCPLLRAPGTNANMTIAANTQKTFGKYDPSPPASPPGSAATNYRVFDPAFVNASKLAIYGGTWNGTPSYQSVGSAGNTAYGIVSLFQLWGIDGLKVFDVDLIGSVGYHVHVLNCRDFEYGNILVDGNASNIGTDGVHINGPTMSVRGGHLRTHCGDDNLALNADDGANSGVWVAGINIQCGGDITDVIAEGPDVWEGSENTVAYGSVRISSTFHRMDNIIINNTIGRSVNSTLFLNQAGVGLCPGPGNYGHIKINGYYHDTTTGYPGNISVNGVFDFLEIKGRYRYNATAVPDIYLLGTFAKLHIEWDGYQPAGASNNTQPMMLMDATIAELKVKATLTADSSIGVRAAPFIRTTPGTSIAYADLDLHGDAITNLVDHTGGTIGTLIMRGCHSNASGGSPLAIASGATVTNYCYSAAGGALAYVIANGAKSGAGTVTNTNVYSGP